MKTIGLLGPQGTFCDLAYKKVCSILNIEEIQPHYYSSISKVAQAINKHDYTILPLENTIDGYVQESLDALLDNECNIVCDCLIPINFSYVSFSTNPDKLYVQFKAHGQCLDFINKMNIDVIQTANNVSSLTEALKYNACAIIPTHLIDTLDQNPASTILNVADRVNNFTRFVVISKDKHYIKEVAKCSIWIYAYDDHPGMLSAALEIFQEHHVNLIAIMSRPTKNQLGNYNFYLEFIVTDDIHNKIDLIINELEKSNDFSVKVLGIYSLIEES